MALTSIATSTTTRATTATSTPATTPNRPRPDARHGRSFWLLAALVAWSLGAVGGVYGWAGGPLILGALILAFVARPAVGGSPETRTLDRLLFLVLAAALVQLVPLPRVARALLTPRRDGLSSDLWLGSHTTEWAPATLDAPATAYALGILAAAVIVFWTVRRLCGREGARGILRVVAVAGLAAGVSAIVQQAIDPTRIYGLWDAVDEGARPFGPFVNRNHFATWAAMAIPLSTGYLASAAAMRRSAPRATGEIASWVRGLASSEAWVAMALVVLCVSVVISTSRSGLLACGVALGAMIVLGRRRATRETVLWGSAGLVVLAAALAGYASLHPLLARAEETLQVGAGGRPRIWLDTLTIIREFWLTGTGQGSYQSAMVLYQQPGLAMFANQAHNQYLQLLAEGGLLLTVPLLLTGAAFIRLFIVRLRRDTTPLVWMRIGGAAAMAGVAVQSGWETGLRMPANAVLFALAAGVAVHRPSSRPRERRPKNG